MSGGIHQSSEKDLSRDSARDSSKEFFKEARDFKEIQKDLSAGSLFELGQVYCNLGEFDPAIGNLTVASEKFLSAKQFENYLNCVNLLLRMYAEMEDFKSIQQIKEKLQSLSEKEGVQLNPKVYYSLALCASYRQQFKVALEYLEKSLTLALSEDNKQEICYAINGLAAVYVSLGRYDDALREIYNLEVFFQVLPFPELRLWSLLLNGHILWKMSKYEQAVEIFTRCYDLLRERKNLFMYVTLLYNLGVTYSHMGEQEKAHLHLTLARKLSDPNNFRRITRAIEEHLKGLGYKDDTEYDLVVQTFNNTVFERKRGKVDFKNQFILLDLLKLFLESPGQVYSKELLVKKVWKQEYDPSVHDNKIYVTIKRLRKMIEPEFEKPRYIFRAKNGYFLNRNVKVLMEQ